MKKYMEELVKVNEDADFLNFISVEKDNMMIENSIRDEATKKGLKEGLKDVQDKLVLPEPCKNSIPSWFGFLITCKEGLDRNKVVEYLENKYFLDGYKKGILQLEKETYKRSSSRR